MDQKKWIPSQDQCQDDTINSTKNGYQCEDDTPRLAILIVYISSSRSRELYATTRTTVTAYMAGGVGVGGAGGVGVGGAGGVGVDDAGGVGAPTTPTTTMATGKRKLSLALALLGNKPARWLVSELHASRTALPPCWRRCLREDARPCGTQVTRMRRSLRYTSSQVASS